MTARPSVPGNAGSRPRAKIIEDLLAKASSSSRRSSSRTAPSAGCHTPIEFLQVKQWFIRIMDFKKEVLAKADEIEWFPSS